MDMGTADIMDMVIADMGTAAIMDMVITDSGTADITDTGTVDITEGIIIIVLIITSIPIDIITSEAGTVTSEAVIVTSGGNPFANINFQW